MVSFCKNWATFGSNIWSHVGPTDEPLLQSLELDFHGGQVTLDLELVLLHDLDVLLLSRTTLLILERQVVRVLDVLHVFRQGTLVAELNWFNFRLCNREHIREHPQAS